MSEFVTLVFTDDNATHPSERLFVYGVFPSVATARAAKAAGLQSWLSSGLSRLTSMNDADRSAVLDMDVVDGVRITVKEITNWA